MVGCTQQHKGQSSDNSVAICTVGISHTKITKHGEHFRRRNILCYIVDIKQIARVRFASRNRASYMCWYAYRFRVWSAMSATSTHGMRGISMEGACSCEPDFILAIERLDLPLTPTSCYRHTCCAAVWRYNQNLPNPAGYKAYAELLRLDDTASR